MEDRATVAIRLNCSLQPLNLTSNPSEASEEFRFFASYVGHGLNSLPG